jgi:hypothetical protein
MDSNWSVNADKVLRTGFPCPILPGNMAMRYINVAQYPGMKGIL